MDLSLQPALLQDQMSDSFCDRQRRKHRQARDAAVRVQLREFQSIPSIVLPSWDHGTTCTRFLVMPSGRTLGGTSPLCTATTFFPRRILSSISQLTQSLLLVSADR